MNTPWCVLLIKFSDDAAEPYDRSRYVEIFTSRGAGKWSMPDYFADMSHGSIDLAGTQVFGWYTLSKTKSEYVGGGANKQGRRDLISWARQKAIDEGVNVDEFYSVVVVFNDDVDLFGGGYGAVCGDDGSRMALSGLSVSLLGQEMAHVYGLHHSRRDGLNADYEDPFDVMSSAATRMSPHPIYGEREIQSGDPVFRIGPGLNAANMFAMGWLDATRTWEAGIGSQVDTTIELRPLHRRDLPGLLAARVGDYFIEFRMNEGWDAALDPAVMIHYFEDGRSYIVPNERGSLEFRAGDELRTPEIFSVFGSGRSITISEIDAANRVARILIRVRQPEIPRIWPKEGPFVTPWIKWAEVEAGNISLVITRGRVIPISKKARFHDAITTLAMSQDDSARRLSPKLQQAMRTEALRSVAGVIERELSALEFSEPAKPSQETPSANTHSRGKT